MHKLPFSVKANSPTQEPGGPLRNFTDAYPRGLDFFLISQIIGHIYFVAVLVMGKLFHLNSPELI